MIILKTKTGNIPANETEVLFTDVDIKNDSIIEIYYDSNDVYTVETSQIGNTVKVLTNEHDFPVGVKLLINNVTSFSPYDPTEIEENIEVINNTLETHTSVLASHSNEIINLQHNKQDNLVAGDNITIVNNVISAVGGGGFTQINAICVNKNSSQTITVNNSSGASTNTLLTGYRNIGNNNSDMFEMTTNGIKIKKKGKYLVLANFSMFVASTHFLQGCVKRYRPSTGATSEVCGFGRDCSSTFTTGVNGMIELDIDDELRIYMGGGYGSFTYTINYNTMALPTSITAILLNES